MEKIKASEILKLKPEITLEELKKFKFFGIDPFNKKVLLFTHYPYSKPSRQQSPLGLESWENPISIAVCSLYDRELGKSLREIDFLEEEDKEIIIKATGFLEIIKNAPNPFFRIEKERILFTSEEGIPVVEVAELVKQIIIKAELNYFAINKNGDMNLYSKKPTRSLAHVKWIAGGFCSDVIYKNHDGSLTTTKPEPTRIFELDDIVHIMYGSDFGKSVLAKVVELLKTNLVRIKFENEMTMIIEERFLSFAPFSYEHGGFTQVRPMPEPKVGDYGFFYDEENPAFFCYGKLSKIHDIKEANYPYELKGILGLFYRYKYFSYTMPELAESVPVPNTTNQQ